jgi:hypothetical protein
MAKRLSREEKINKCVIEILNEMFKIAGHSVTYDDIKDRKDAWYSEWTMTEDQYKEWQQWGIVYLRKSLKLNKEWAAREMAMIGLNWGLKFRKEETV